MVSRVHVPEDDTEMELSTPLSTIAGSETVSHELVLKVTDSAGEVVAYKTESLRVRSKYDVNIAEIRLRTAQFVNPRNPAVDALVNRADSPLAEAMDGRYSVMGYQHQGGTCSGR